MTAPKLNRIFSAPEEINRRADEALIRGITHQFPIENDRYRLELHN
jgi:hypothetical protein